MQELLTRIWKIEGNIDEWNPLVQEVANELKKGKVIAFPTETVYGLGANAGDTEAVKNIFKAKGRPSDNPLIVHIASVEQLTSLVTEVDEKSKILIEKFWPGPLTIIFRNKGNVSELVSAGLDTIAVRMPSHPVALAIIKASSIPIAAPSANRSGKPSPTTAEHVYNDLDGRIDGIVDGGSTGIGVESTVIDVSGDLPVILRPGGVTLEELRTAIGEVGIDQSLINENERPLSPGMKYKHYAPKGEVLIIKGNEDKIIEEINREIINNKQQGKRVGTLVLENHRDLIHNSDMVLAYGKKNNLYPLAEHLYEALRLFDKSEIDYILIEGVEENGIGLAIMNRLKKAANGNIKEYK